MIFHLRVSTYIFLVIVLLGFSGLSALGEESGGYLRLIYRVGEGFVFGEPLVAMLLKVNESLIEASPIGGGASVCLVLARPGEDLGEPELGYSECWGASCTRKPPEAIGDGIRITSEMAREWIFSHRNVFVCARNAWLEALIPFSGGRATLTLSLENYFLLSLEPTSIAPVIGEFEFKALNETHILYYSWGDRLSLSVGAFFDPGSWSLSIRGKPVDNILLLPPETFHPGVNGSLLVYHHSGILGISAKSPYELMGSAVVVWVRSGLEEDVVKGNPVYWAKKVVLAKGERFPEDFEKLLRHVAELKSEQEDSSGLALVQVLNESYYEEYTGPDPRLLEYYNSTESRPWRPLLVLRETAETESVEAYNYWGVIDVNGLFYDLAPSISVNSPVLLYDRSSRVLEKVIETNIRYIPFLELLVGSNARVYIIHPTSVPDVLVYGFNVTGLALGVPANLSLDGEAVILELVESSVVGFYARAGGSAEFSPNHRYVAVLAAAVAVAVAVGIVGRLRDWGL